jgi:hypothetical protein
MRCDLALRILSNEQVTAILQAAFRNHWPDAWPDMPSALEEVRESSDKDRTTEEAVSTVPGPVSPRRRTLFA